MPSAVPKSPSSPPQSRQRMAIKAVDKPKSNRWLILMLVFICLALLMGIGAMTSLLPKKAKAVQVLRSAGISSQMSEQDETLLNQALEDTKAQRDQLEAAFPTEANLLTFIRIIDQIRADKKVEIERFTVDSDIPTKIGRAPSFLPMTLVLRGKAAEVAQALKQISDSPYFLKPITFSKEFNPTTDSVVVQTQFHLYVADDFSAPNPKPSH